MPIVTVSKKGWVVIPAEMRKRYNIKPGDKMVIVDYGGIAMFPAEKTPEDVIKRGWGLFKDDPGGMEFFIEEHRKEQEREEEKYARWFKDK